MAQDNTNVPQILRMPIAVGPGAGPRQDQHGLRFRNIEGPRTRTYAARFETDPAALQGILPPAFALDGEPVVTIEVQYMTEIEWLAGRGYNTVGIRFPARYGDTHGSFLLVLFENMADPIISGREELGFSKLYADIADPQEVDGRKVVEVSWGGTTFLTLEFEEEYKPGFPPSGGEARRDGLLHYKYIPATGRWGEADVEYPVLTPLDLPNLKPLSAAVGEAQATWSPGPWETFPTLHHLIDKLAALPVKAWRQGSITETLGGKDFRDQRRLD